MSVRTLHLTNAYHPTSGGIRTFYRALLAAADRRGREMTLVVPGEQDGLETLGRHTRIYSVAARPSPAFDRRYRLLLPSAYLQGARGRLVRILRAVQPDLVEICDKYALFYLAALLRKRLLSGCPRPTLVGLSCERLDDNLAAYVREGAAARRLGRAYLRHVYGPPFDVHVANSEYTAGELRAALHDRAPGFVQVCPMGVDVASFHPSCRDLQLRSALLAQAGGHDRNVLLLYAGRLSPEKNLPLLVDTLAALQRASAALDRRDYRLLLVGDGPEALALSREAAARVPGRIHWMRSVEQRGELARIYASADVFLHPNPREPFGIAPLEAMASGLRVVAPRAGGVLSYATDENAWLAEPSGPDFARAVRASFAHDAPRRLRAARATAEAHDWPLIADRYFALYDLLHARVQTAFAAQRPGGTSPLTQRRVPDIVA